MATEPEHLALARRFIAAVERGATDEVAALLAEDVLQEEFPNRLLPNGARRDRAAMLEAAGGRLRVELGPQGVEDALAVQAPVGGERQQLDQAAGVAQPPGPVGDRPAADGDLEAAQEPHGQPLGLGRARRAIHGRAPPAHRRAGARR